MQHFLITLLITCMCTFHTQTADEGYTDEQKLRNSFSKLDSSQLNTELYSDITYTEYVNSHKALILNDSLVQLHYLEDKFTSPTPSICREDYCRTPMYEISNSNLGEQSRKRLPTILLVAGVHGKETLGIRALVEFVRFSQKMYQMSQQWYKLINNNRILVIPAINMSGFNHGIDEEITQIQDQTYRVDPKFDFNLLPRDFCFSSFTSQVLSALFHEYIVLGTLVFTNGPFRIDFPNLQNVLGNGEEIADQTLMFEMTHRLTNLFNFHSTEVKMELKNDEKNSITENVNNQHASSYIHWAFGASSSQHFISTECFIKKNRFVGEYKPPSDQSNRALAIEISLDKEQVKSPLTQYMGNEIYAANRHQKESQKGIISALLATLQQFVEIINPFITLREIRTEKKSDKANPGKRIDFFFELYGFMDFQNGKISEPEPSSQVQDSESDSLFITLSTQVLITGFYENEKNLKDSKEYNFQFDMNFAGIFKFSFLKKGTGMSHYLQRMVNPKYYIMQNSQILNGCSMDHYSVKKVITSNISTGMIIEMYSTHSKIYYSLNYLVQVAQYFPILLSYDKDTFELSFQVLPSKIPDPAKKTHRKNYWFQSGIHVQTNYSEYNPKFRDQIGALSPDAADLELLIYNTFSSFICSEIETDLVREQHETLMTELSQTRARLKESSANTKLLRRQVSDEKVLQNLQNKLDVNGCSKYYNLKTQELSDAAYYLKLNSKTKLEILPTNFIRLLGSVIRIKFTRSQQMHSQESLADSPSEGGKDNRIVELNGSIVMVDPMITGLPKSNELEDFPEPGKVIKMAELNYMDLSRDDLICSSVFPVMPVTTSDLKMIIKSKEVPRSNENNYFSINIRKDFNDSRFTTITLFTNKPSQSGRFFIHNKRKVFELKKTNRKIEFSSKISSNEIVIYEGRFPSSELGLLGLYILVYDENEKLPSFDCFMNVNRDEFNAKTEYILYKSIQEELQKIRNDEIWKNSARSLSVSLTLAVVVLLLICAVVFGIWFYKNKKNKSNSEDTNQKPLAVDK